MTGGNGFIGSYVIEELIRQGFDVMVFDHSAPGNLGLIGPTVVNSKVEFFYGDIRDDVAVTEAAAHVDGIIHLAAVLGTQETIQNPRPAAETNILGGLNVLEAAAQYHLPVVYAGVGNHWMRNDAAGTYTITKTAVEDFVRMFNAFRSSNISVVRPVNAYGPRQSIATPYGPSKVRKIMPSFICRALLGEDIEVYGDGTQISDCVHVSDVAHVFVEALKWTWANGPAPRPFEVGPINSVTVNDIASSVQQLALARGTTPQIHHLPMRPGEVPNAVVRADVSTLELLDIDASQFISLADGIDETLNWYADHWLPAYEGDRR